MIKKNCLKCNFVFSGFFALVIIALSLVFTNSALASNCIASDGAWNEPGTWSECADGIPLALDAAIIPAGIDVTINDAGAVAATVTLENPVADSNSLTIAAPGTLTLTGALTLAGSSGAGNSTVAVADGTLSAGSISIVGGASTGKSKVSVSTGTITVTGDVSLSGTTVNSHLISTSDSNINIGGDFILGGMLNSVFNVGSGASSTVYSIAPQADGKILIGGNFTTYNGTARNRIARINTDGSLDTTFDPGTGASSTVQSLVLQDDGKVLIGGAFTTYNGTARNRIARLNADGSLDTTFNPSTGANATIFSIAPQADGKILIGGGFTTYNGTARNRIARINTDGSLDTTFDPGTGVSGTVYSIAPQADGKILIGGFFATFNGTVRSRIARLNADGSLDTTFNPSTGANGTIYSIAPQADGKILIGGGFTTYNGTARNYIARLNADGSLDTTFDPGTGASNNVQSLVLQDDGKILIGGFFGLYNGTARNRIARLNTDGSLDTTFDPGTGASSNVQSLVLQDDGKILIGGDFTTYNGTARNRITLLSADGSLGGSGTITFNGAGDQVIGSSEGFNNIIVDKESGTAIINAGIVYLHGYLSIQSGTLSFDSTSGQKTFARDVTIEDGGTWSEDAGVTVTYGGNLTNHGTYIANTGVHTFVGFNKTIDGDISIPNLAANATITNTGNLTISSDLSGFSTLTNGVGATLNIGGTSTINGLTATALDSTVKYTKEGDQSVKVIDYYNLTLSGSGVKTMGGVMDVAKNLTIDQGISPIVISLYGDKKIARLNADGSLDGTFDPGTGVNNSVQYLALQDDGKILIGGFFFSYNFISRNHIARINTDGSLDETFDPGFGTDSTINSVAVQGDGKILIGGEFSYYYFDSRNRIARLNTDGSLDTTFDPGTGTNGAVNSVAVEDDGKIIIGGAFTTYNDIARSKIARINTDGSLDTSFNPGTGANGTVESLILQDDGKILIGGAFTTYNDIARSKIARLNADGSLDTTFNPSTGASSTVQSLALQDDGKILIGGDFTTYNGTARNRIARINTDGSLDTTFDPGTGASSTVYSIAPQADGKILIGGNLTTYNGTARNRIARINTDGSLDTTFDPGTGASSTIYSIAPQADGKITAAGLSFTYGSKINITANALRVHGSWQNRGTWGSTASAATNTSDVFFADTEPGIITVSREPGSSFTTTTTKVTTTPDSSTEENEVVAEEVIETKPTDDYTGCTKDTVYSVSTGKSCAGYVVPATTTPIVGCGDRTTGFSTTTGKSCAGNVTPTTAIPGCDGRATGFSVTTGKSCVGNTVLPSSSTNSVTTVPTTSPTTPATSSTYTFGDVTVALWYQGPACRAWQQFLNDKAGASLSVDGLCGPMTISAAKSWQASVGLVADGFLGSLSRAKALTQ